MFVLGNLLHVLCNVQTCSPYVQCAPMHPTGHVGNNSVIHAVIKKYNITVVHIYAVASLIIWKHKSCSECI